MYGPMPSKDPNANLLHALEDQTLRFIPLLRYQQALENLCTAYEAPLAAKVDYGAPPRRNSPAMHRIPVFRGPFSSPSPHNGLAEPVDSHNPFFVRRASSFCDCSGEAYKEVCECSKQLADEGGGFIVSGPEQPMVPVGLDPPTYLVHEGGYHPFHRGLDVGLMKREGQHVVVSNEHLPGARGANHYLPVFAFPHALAPQFVWVSDPNDNANRQQSVPVQEPAPKKGLSLETKAQEFALSPECTKLVEAVASRNTSRMPYTRHLSTPSNP